MNYKEINLAILENRDVDNKLVKKNERFYKYLSNNKVAYYYSKYLSKDQTEKEKWIIQRGEELNNKYIETLTFLEDICSINNIRFLLYKTHKYIPEVVDGDIDVFVKKEDFYKFMQVLEKEGFKCVEDEPGKGKCEKDNFLVIEPHINISWRQGEYTKEAFIWENTRKIKEDIFLQVEAASAEIELISLIGKVYFEPQYLDLYSRKTIRYFFEQDTINIQSILKNINFGEAFEYLVLKERSINIKKKAPFFMDPIHYLYYWWEQCRKNKNWKYFLLHIVYYVYWNFRYSLIDKLPFSHNWK